ncbi:MAG: hypothetical protein AAGM84_05035 [Pseudomonadota bacterium]
MNQIQSSGALALHQIEKVGQAARGTWLVLLGTIVFLLVTTLSVEENDFFGLDRGTELPLIGINVPTSTFFGLGRY